MENIDLIALLLTIIAMFVAIFIFRRILVIVAVIIILGVIGYFILQNNQGTGQSNNVFNNTKTGKISYLEKFKDHYCSLLYDKDDSLMCYVIAQPIYNDIVKNYDPNELNSMNKKEFAKILIQAAYRHKNEILKKLKKNKAYLWEDFVLDLKNANIY